MQPPTLNPAAAPAALAKGALRRLARAQQEPTPENYARAYAEEAGAPPPAAAESVPAGNGAAAEAADAKAAGQAWAGLVERLARNLERGGRQWTAARRKDSLRRVLDGSRSDAAKLLQRLQALMGSWEADQPSDPAFAGAEDPPLHAATPAADTDPHPAGSGAAAAVPAARDWLPLTAALGDSVRAALPQQAADLAGQLARLADALAAEGPTPQRVAEIEDACRQAQRLFAHRHRLVDELAALCRELTAGMTELAEEDSWARGQCTALQARLEEDATSVRAVRAAGALLAEARQHQHAVRAERAAARESLKQLIKGMLQEVGELGTHTGRFQVATAQHAEAIAAADTLEGLAGVVRALIDDARTVQTAVAAANDRLQADSLRATVLEDKVRALETELLRLSEEVSTDALTQVANRRGLMQAFEAESARAVRRSSDADEGDEPRLAVGLIDIDNFKKLNDSLGHAAGDQALQALAAAVAHRLRPGDHLARFGGEEFVVLLPETEVDEAQQTLTRLQRSLSEALFLHEGKQVFVTFSAGVTAWRAGEALEAALERADLALYEAKRSGKNRTNVG